MVPLDLELSHQWRRSSGPYCGSGNGLPGQSAAKSSRNGKSNGSHTFGASEAEPETGPAPCSDTFASRRVPRTGDKAAGDKIDCGGGARGGRTPAGISFRFGSGQNRFAAAPRDQSGGFRCKFCRSNESGCLGETDKDRRFRRSERRAPGGLFIQ